MFDVERLVAGYGVMAEVTGWQTDGLPSAAAIAARVSWVESVNSTNSLAWELMAVGAEPIAIAGSQTAGRGQWGRQWRSPTGGLYLSVGVALNLELEQAALLTMATGWGLARALRMLPAGMSGTDQGIPVQIKWLNDLVLQGRKLGGILTETRIQQGRIAKAVIGVGLNWANPVPAPGINLATYLATQPDPLIESLEGLAAIALHGIFQGLAHLQRGEVNPILTDYWAWLTHRDRDLDWQGQTWAIVGVTAAGNLRIQCRTAANPEGNPTESAVVLLSPGTISLGYDDLRSIR